MTEIYDPKKKGLLCYIGIHKWKQITKFHKVCMKCGTCKIWEGMEFHYSPFRNRYMDDPQHKMLIRVDGKWFDEVVSKRKFDIQLKLYYRWKKEEDGRKENEKSIRTAIEKKILNEP